MASSTKLGVAILVVLALAAAGVLYFYFSVESVVAAAIERYGARATGTEVRVARVQLSVRSGEGSVSGLKVGNPPGYTSPYAFALGRIQMRLDTATLTQRPIVIEEIRVQAPQFFYEINQAGDSNILTIKRHATSREQPASRSPPPDEGIRLVVRRLLVEGGRVEGRLAALEDKRFTVKLPRIELRDLGREQGGATPSEIAREVAVVLARRAGQTAAQMGIERYLGRPAEEVRDRLGDKIERRLGKEVEEVTDEVLERFLSR